MRVIPSVRLTTVPSVRASVGRSYSWIFFLIRSLISMALIVIGLSQVNVLLATVINRLLKSPLPSGEGGMRGSRKGDLSPCVV